jgi:phosphofructokinase-like protein
MAKKVGLLTGGGDCPGLNPALRGVVMRGLDHGFEFTGFLEGWRGLVEGNTQPVTLADVKEIVGKGGTFLGSSRTNPFKKDGAVEKCLANFKKFNLDALVACGGEDTLGVAAKLYKEHKVNVVGVPKTMDNDLSATDYTFGFDTATTVAVDALERLRDTGRSHRRIMVLEVMGRHAGWVALYASIASAADWVLLPERPTDVKAMCAHLKKVHARDKVALVVTSEAVELPGEDHSSEQLDQFGHMLLKNRGLGEKVAGIIEKETGIETRSAVIGHIQRGGAPTLFDRILATRAGVKAADMIAAGEFGKMAAMKGIEMIAVPLSEATAKLKTVTPEWLKLADTFFK